MNPFLSQYTTPHGSVPFDKINISDYEDAMLYGIEEENKEIANIISNSEAPTFVNTILALEKSGNTLRKVTDVFFNQLSCETSDSLDEMSEKLVPLLTEHSNSIMLNTSLFKKVEAVVKSQPQLADEEQKLLEDTYDSFLRHGASLDEQQKLEYDKLTSELNVLKLKFAQNKLKEQNDFILNVTNEKEIIGVPQNCKDEARAEALRRNMVGWVFTLHAPSYVPFMEYCDNRELRRQMYMAYNTICNRNNDCDNKVLVKTITNLRLRIAKLLGYSSHAEYTLQKRMAKDTETVNRFIIDLLTAYKPTAIREVEDVCAFAKQINEKAENTDGFKLMPWDFSYYSNKLKEKLYNLNSEKLKPYFEIGQVKEGVFGLATKLYGITFARRTDIPVYNRDVEVYEVFDNNGKHLSLLYCDFYPRSSKKSGAWMTNYKEQWMEEGGENSRPHVALNTNFSKPTQTEPSLLTLDEVETFLHEFGHTLHGMFANTRFRSLSGTNVYWDFVELPSQFMENYAIEPEFLRTFAKHYKTGEIIPDEMVECVRNSRNFNAAYKCLRQLTFCKLDMAYHSLTKELDEEIEDFERQAIKEAKLMPEIPGTSISVQFSHIMDGGYSSGYYSYKWAEVMDADVFEKFKEEGIFNKATAQEFREKILALGGTKHPMDLYVDFRGKAPDNGALLRRNNIFTNN